MIKSIWAFFGSLRLTLWVLILVSLNMAIGSYYARFYGDIFKPLNDYLLQDWFLQYGRNHPDKIWWLVTLLFLLFLLGLNTAVCTLNRIVQLWPKRTETAIKQFLIKLAPSGIHLCFLVIITGHLLEMVTGINLSFVAQEKAVLALPENCHLKVLAAGCEKYDSPGLESFAKQCSVSLDLIKNDKSKKQRIEILKPLFWEGFSIHLLMIRGDGDSPGLKLYVKRDPGLKFILTGFVVMILVLLWYYSQGPRTEQRE